MISRSQAEDCGLGTGGLYRGDYRLAHMSQVNGVDEKAREIGLHLGGTCHGFRLTDDQLRERVETGRGGLPYRYVVYAPDSPASSWTAFYDREELQAFMMAYGCELESEPSEDTLGSFRMLLPQTRERFKPLVRERRVRYRTYNLPNAGFLEIDTDSEHAAVRKAWGWVERVGSWPYGALRPTDHAVRLDRDFWRVRLR